jgi:hypothetical protein
LLLLLLLLLLPPLDGRLGSQIQGYYPVAPRPLRYRPFVQRL